jgi:hypothetical protein
MTWAILLRNESLSSGNDLPPKVGSGATLPPVTATRWPESLSIIQIQHRPSQLSRIRAKPTNPALRARMANRPQRHWAGTVKRLLRGAVMQIEFNRTIPILRIFDVAKADDLSPRSTELWRLLVSMRRQRDQKRRKQQCGKIRN